MTRESEHGPLIVADPAFGEPIAASSAPVPAPRDGSAERRRSVTSARDLSELYFAPIAGTAREAQAIRLLFRDATVLAGERATESSVRQFGAPRMLHIATHGFFLQHAGIAPQGRHE